MYAVTSTVKLDANAFICQFDAMATGRTTLTNSHQVAWARLVRASERIQQHAEAALKEARLPPLAWYDLLLELKRAEPDGLRPYQLQSEMLIPQYNMSRLIDRIAKSGYIERLSCDDDGRGQVIRITAEGKALQRKMWPIYRSVLQREIAENLSEAEAINLSAMLGPLAGRN